MRGRAVLVAALSCMALWPASGAAAGRSGPERVVLISLPGVSWEDIRDARLPNIERYLGSIAAMSARTAHRLPDITRGYLTLGAGNPAFVPLGFPQAHQALEADERFEGSSAHEVAARRTGLVPDGEIVHVAVPTIQQFQDTRLFGSRVGSLGEALKQAGIERGVVSAADLGVDPTLEFMRRGAVLSLMDESGAVDHGVITGLLRPNPQAPYGVETDPGNFAQAAQRVLRSARVVLLDPGETWRADEYGSLVAPEQVPRLRRQALTRSDAIVGRLAPLLTPRDMVLVVGPTGPTGRDFPEHLTPLGAWGRRADGATFGQAWLTSPTTGRDGMVVLSDVAPAVLNAFGISRPDSMVGTPIRQGGPRADGASSLIELDHASSVRESFSVGAFWVISVLLSLVAILAFVVFLAPRARAFPLLVAVVYFGLAIFPAAHVIRAFSYWRAGVIGAHLLLYAVAALLAVAAWRLPGPRWAGAVALFALTALLFGSDAVAGGPLQVNGLFGHSPLVAGRFYGVSNPGYAILFSAALLGVTGASELRGRRRLHPVAIALLVALIPLIGLPAMGADFGGLVAGVPAVGVTIALGMGGRIRWRTVLILAAVAGAVALGLSFADLLRAPEARTHLGRFAETLMAGNVEDVVNLIRRKLTSSVSSLTITRWTYLIPFGLAVLVLLLLRPRGILREILAARPLLRAGLWGTLVAGVLGFAVNDSGVSIPALAMAFAVPFLVLIAVDTVEPRNKPPPG